MTILYTLNKKDKCLYILSIWIFGILISVSLSILFFLLAILFNEEGFIWFIILLCVLLFYFTITLFVSIFLPFIIMHIESYIDEGKIHIVWGRKLGRHFEFPLEDVQIKLRNLPLSFVGKTSIVIIPQNYSGNKRKCHKRISLVAVCSKKRAMEIVDLIETEKRKTGCL